MAGFAGCGSGRKKVLNDRITLWRADKIPYGTWYAYNHLSYLFPEATMAINKRAPGQYVTPISLRSSDDIDKSNFDAHKIAYIIICEKVVPDKSEATALLDMVGQGNHVFISTHFIGPTLLDELRLKLGFSFNSLEGDSMTVQVNDPVSNQPSSYTYPGARLDRYFMELDTSITTVLGRDQGGRPDFVKFSYKGGGTLFIHMAPLAFSNFFLLHKNNKAYYDQVLSYLPHNSQLVYWDDYYRYNSADADGSFSSLGWLLKQPPFAIAFWLLLLLLLMICLFEAKRRQRLIPVIAPLKNSSLDFVKTIGRLYYQQHDNKNLAQKMITYFQDHVRTRYNIRVAFMDEDFETRLSYKSGYNRDEVRNLVYYLKLLQEEPTVSDELLLKLSNKLDHFYTATQPVIAKT